MLQSVEIFLDNPLFQGVRADEMLPLLECLQARKQSYAKGQRLMTSGTAADRLGIVLTGHISTIYEDAFGGRSIIGSFGPGQLFCDAFSCSTLQALPVSVAAEADSTVALIPIENILHTCGKRCPQHQLLMENLVHILADKYVAISRKMVHLSGRTTRRKLLSYLSEQMRLAGGNPFAIPFHRQELADYLFVDRTGLSTEWSRLKKDGLLAEEGGLLRLNIAPCDGADCEETAR